MPNERSGKTVDKTFLSVDTAEQRGFLHRDYLAHAFRWSHVCKFLQEKGRYKEARILDIGCGKEVPMAKMLYSSRFIPLGYLGVDVTRFELPETFHTGKFPIRVLPETDILEVTFNNPETPRFNLAVCFEVLEHVEPSHAIQILRHLHTLMTPGADLFFSTPCYSEKMGAAANHVNEMTYEVFGSILESTGWEIIENWGTFASQRDYEVELRKRGLSGVYEQLHDYYDSNVLACIFAPLFPELSRNCLWHVRRCTNDSRPRFRRVDSYVKPWGSTTNEEWDLALKELYNAKD